MLHFVNLKELSCFSGNKKIVYSEPNVNDNVPGHVIPVTLSDRLHTAPSSPPPSHEPKRLTNYSGETVR